MNSGAPEVLPVPALLVTPVVLLLHDKKIIWHKNTVGHKYAYINTNNIYKTWTPDKTNGNKDEPNIVFTQKW